MKFLVLCTLILSIAFFVASAQAQGQGAPSRPKADDVQPPIPHHHAVRSVPDDKKVPPKGEAGCCG